MDQPPTLQSVTPEQRQNIETALKNNPNQMTLLLARQLGVPEIEIVRGLPAERAVELDVHRWEQLLRALQDLGDLRVLLSNSTVTCEVVGHFGGFSTWGEFFNVQTRSLDLHLRPAQFAGVFAVVKPSHVSGAETLSFQFFDREGAAVLKVFLVFDPESSPARQEAFEHLREAFRKR